MAERITVLNDGANLSRLLWARYKTNTAPLIQATLNANPGLALVCNDIPAGIVIVLPDISAVQVAARRPVVRLWD